MPIGAGGAPGGSSLGGYGTPDAAHVPNNAILPAVQTGFAQSGRMINPVTKDYVFTPDGRLQGQSTAQQLVTLALTTSLGSSAVGTLGQTFSSIKEKGADFKQRVSSSVARALADLVRGKIVEIVALTVTEYQNSPDAGLCQLSWRDMTTGVVTVTAIGS